MIEKQLLAVLQTILTIRDSRLAELLARAAFAAAAVNGGARIVVAAIVVCGLGVVDILAARALVVQAVLVDYDILAAVAAEGALPFVFPGSLKPKILTGAVRLIEAIGAALIDERGLYVVERIFQSQIGVKIGPLHAPYLLRVGRVAVHLLQKIVSDAFVLAGGAQAIRRHLAGVYGLQDLGLVALAVRLRQEVVL